MDIDRKTQREPDRDDLWQGTRIIQHNDVVQNSIVNWTEVAQKYSACKVEEKVVSEPGCNHPTGEDYPMHNPSLNCAKSMESKSRPMAGHPLASIPDGPLKNVLPAIRARLEQTRGDPITEGQILSKWILQKGAIMITGVICISG